MITYLFIGGPADGRIEAFPEHMMDIQLTSPGVHNYTTGIALTEIHNYRTYGFIAVHSEMTQSEAAEAIATAYRNRAP